MMTEVPAYLNVQFGMMSWSFLMLLSVALLLFIYRCFKHEVGVVDWLIIGTMVGSTVLVATQEYIHIRLFASTWRYLYPGYALAVIYCGLVIASVCKRLPILRVIMIMIVIVAGRKLIRMVHRDATNTNNFWAALKAAEEESAALIRTDWKGPLRDGEINPYEFVQRRRPIVHGGSGRCAYLAGGRQTDYQQICLRKEGFPDYWFIIRGRGEKWANEVYGADSVASRELMKTFNGPRWRFDLYRTKREK